MKTFNRNKTELMKFHSRWRLNLPFRKRFLTDGHQCNNVCSLGSATVSVAAPGVSPGASRSFSVRRDAERSTRDACAPQIPSQFHSCPARRASFLRSRLNLLTFAAVFVGVQFYGATIHAAQLSDEEIQALIKRVDELEQEVKALKRNREVDKENAKEQAKQTPTVSLGMNGLNVRSGDSNFIMYAHGYAQIDGRNYFGQKTTPDTFLLRRVRPIVEGTVWQDVDYRLMLDVASGNVTGSTANNVSILDDAYVNARYW